MEREGMTLKEKKKEHVEKTGVVFFKYAEIK
jgi:hypothetical protein